MDAQRQWVCTLTLTTASSGQLTQLQYCDFMQMNIILRSGDIPRDSLLPGDFFKGNLGCLFSRA